MNVELSLRRSILLFLLTTVLTSWSFAQGESAAVKVYSAWRVNAFVKDPSGLENSHKGIGFAVSKYGETGVTIDLAIGAGTATSNLAEMEFLVQPLEITVLDGKQSLNSIGQPSIMKSPRLENLKLSDSGVVASPKMTIPLPSGAVAIRIVVKDFGNGEKSITVTLPIGDQTSTGALIKMGKCSSSTRSLTDCQWFTGTCGGGCSGQTLCTGCNNGSPDLNCVTCTMGCAGGGKCTPTTEIPQGCNMVRPS